MNRWRVVVCSILGMLMGSTAARAEVAMVAVATNFAEVMERVVTEFERQSHHRLRVTTGSTGKLYAQIRAGAPFDVLLAADAERPELLEAEGLAIRGTRFTYAMGRLTLWSPDQNLVGADGAEVLRSAAFRRLAMANPDLAPYGAAARQVLEKLELLEVLGNRIVMGENVGQAHAMVATGNAELGFVALAYVLSERNSMPGSRWDVPCDYYEPIRQDAVLLDRAEDNSAARDLLAFLRRPETRELIRSHGYLLD